MLEGLAHLRQVRRGDGLAVPVVPARGCVLEAGADLRGPGGGGGRAGLGRADGTAPPGHGAVPAPGRAAAAPGGARQGAERLPGGHPERPESRGILCIELRATLRLYALLREQGRSPHALRLLRELVEAAAPRARLAGARASRGSCSTDPGRACWRARARLDHVRFTLAGRSHSASDISNSLGTTLRCALRRSRCATSRGPARPWGVARVFVLGDSPMPPDVNGHGQRNAPRSRWRARCARDAPLVHPRGGAMAERGEEGEDLRLGIPGRDDPGHRVPGAPAAPRQKAVHQAQGPPGISGPSISSRRRWSGISPS